ncbi:MAG: DUF4058 family protein [Verrucomicrobiales bacterium]|nr:DUF4058 family protein [Verrucomicrobiales bacterium]
MGCDALQPKLPRDLRARVEERIFLETQPERQFIPDVVVSGPSSFEPPSGWTPVGEEEGSVVVTPPIVFEPVEFTEGYIEIRDRHDQTLITSIEFVSPSNKQAGKGREEYLRKQREVLESTANLVEIDLVRQGSPVIHLPGGDPDPRLARADYLASVTVEWAGQRMEVYPVSIQQRLPVLSIPLRKDDEPLPPDLQQLIDQVYVAGRYDDIDYSDKLHPPLDDGIVTWLKKDVVNTSSDEASK